MEYCVTEAYQTIKISFNYVAKTDFNFDSRFVIDSTPKDHYEDILLPLIDDMIDEGAIKYNNGENIKLCKDYTAYDVDIKDCLEDMYNKGDSGRATFELVLPLDYVTVDVYNEYEGGYFVFSEIDLVDYYITDDSFDMDKIIALFNKYYGEYFELTDFKAEAIPFSGEDINNFEIYVPEPPEDDYKEMIEERMMEEMERRYEND
jgi:hypothetical protein